MLPATVLAIETATSQVGVALHAGDRVLVRESRGQQAPSRMVYAWVRELLAEAGLAATDLEAVLFGAGPGSFTGVRVAAAVAQALGYSRGIPVVPVSTLAVMARPHLAAGRAPAVIAALDARMGELYVGTYVAGEGGDVVSVGGDSIAAPEAGLSWPAQPFLAVGPGFDAYPALLDQAGSRLQGVEAGHLPDVRDLLALGLVRWQAGAALAAAAASPNYLRARVTR